MRRRADLVSSFQAKEEKDRADKEAKEKQDKADKERALQEAEAKKEAARRDKEAREEREKEAQAQALAQAQARLLSQQRTAAAKSAATAQLQSKLQKSSKGNAAASAKAAKQPVKASTSTLPTPVSAPAAVSAEPSASSSRSGSPPKVVSTMPTPNVRPPPHRVPSAGHSPSVHQPLPQQVMGHQGPFGQGASVGPPGMLGGAPMSAPQYSMVRPPIMVSPGASPPGVGLASGSGSASNNVQPSPFPSQVPGYSPNARAPATSPGGYPPGGLPSFGHGLGGMQPSPVFSQAMPGSTMPSVSPAASRSFLPDNNGNNMIDHTLVPGMRNVGIGHPTKSQRSVDDLIFSAGGIGSSRVPSDQDQSMGQQAGHDYRSFKRPDPTGPGPIEPIGRPRPQLSSSGLDILDEAGPSTSTSRRASPPFADKVLGSAALLADDDDVIGPAPRRVSNNASLGASWSTGGAIGTSGGQWGASAFGASPGIWGGSSTGVPSTSANWPTSAGPFNQPSRFDGSKSAGPGPIGHMPPNHVGNRGGFSAPGMGPPGGMPFAPQQGVNIFSPPQQPAGANQHPHQQHPHH